MQSITEILPGIILFVELTKKKSQILVRPNNIGGIKDLT
jgi:hypothetical protein